MSPKTPLSHIAAGVDHDDVAGLGVIERVAMELLFRLGILVDAVEIFALRHELQRQRRPGNRPAGGAGRRAADVGVADPHPVEGAARRGGADPLQGVDPFARRAGDVIGLDHRVST